MRSRAPVAQVNEVLGKVLAHNLRTLIHSQCELGIEPVFWPEESDVPDVLRLPMGAR